MITLLLFTIVGLNCLALGLWLRGNVDLQTHKHGIAVQYGKRAFAVMWR